MTDQGPFNDRDELIATVLRFYRAHSATLSGPTEATRKLWPRIRRRIPTKLLHELAQSAVSHEVRQRATNASGSRSGWASAHGMVKITYRTPDAPSQQTDVIQVPITQVPYGGPTKLYPRILEQTIYATATVAKQLLEFTLPDFVFCIASFEEQRHGIDRRITAMHAGMDLITKHQVTSLKDVPLEDLDAFALQWQAAVQRPRGEEADVA